MTVAARDPQGGWARICRSGNEFRLEGEGAEAQGPRQEIRKDGRQPRGKRGGLLGVGGDQTRGRTFPTGPPLRSSRSSPSELATAPIPAPPTGPGTGWRALKERQRAGLRTHLRFGLTQETETPSPSLRLTGETEAGEGCGGGVLLQATNGGCRAPHARPGSPHSLPPASLPRGKGRWSGAGGDPMGRAAPACPRPPWRIPGPAAPTSAPGRAAHGGRAGGRLRGVPGGLRCPVAAEQAENL